MLLIASAVNIGILVSLLKAKQFGRVTVATLASGYSPPPTTLKAGREDYPPPNGCPEPSMVREPVVGFMQELGGPHFHLLGTRRFSDTPNPIEY